MTQSNPTERPGKIRHCWNCGADMGFVENRFHDRMDTCGSRECERAVREAFEDERQAAHDRVDEDFGYGSW